MFFIRTATAADAGAIRDLLVASWRHTYVRFHGPEKVEPVIARWHSYDAVKANIEARHGEMLVADDGAELGGMAFAMISDDRKSVQLKQLYVHPAHLRKGIGRELFAEIETCFPGAESLELEVDRKNGAAIAFYAAHGMEISGETGCCGGDSDIPAFLMSKPLAG